MNKTYKVYEYIFPDGKVYVGCTSMELAERRDSGYRHNPQLKEAMRTVGWRNIKKVIVQDGLSEADALALEEKTIRELDATNRKKGYNISFGGRSTFKGLRHTDATKQRISQAHKGSIATDQARANMRMAHKAERIPVCAVDENGRSIDYESLGDAALAVGGYKSNIKRAAQSGKPYKGMVWQLSEGR
jgi:hypothetical protein